MKRVFFMLLAFSCLLTSCSNWNLGQKEINPGGNTSTGSSGTVFSKGTVAIPVLKGFDLDVGTVLDDGSDPADMYWNTEPNSTGGTRGDIFPHNYARFTITTMDKSLLDNPPSTLYTTLKQQSYSDDVIYTDSSTPLRTGSVVAYQTSSGRYGLFRVDKLGSDLVLNITWLTYNK